MDNYGQHLEVARRLAQEAGSILMNFFGRAKVSEKSPQNLVTEADLASEKAITRGIQQVFPSHLLLCEEGESTANGYEDDVWVIDPLDATNNYAHGIPHFSVSIAYARRGRPRIGVIWDPIRKEEFCVQAGQGAFLNDVRIHCSTTKHLEESIIATGFYYDRGALMERTLDGIRHLFHRRIRGIRRTGGAALDLCWTACGRFDGFFEYELAPWDYAAGALMVQEAGGICTDRSGAPLELTSRHIIAGTSPLHRALLSAVKWEAIE